MAAFDKACELLRCQYRLNKLKMLMALLLAPSGTLSRHQQHIAQLRNAGPTDVGIGEPEDPLRTELVATAVAPTMVGVVGPRCDHSEGHHRRRRDMPGAIGADEWIDMVCQSRARSRQRWSQE